MPVEWFAIGAGLWWLWGLYCASNFRLRRRIDKLRSLLACRAIDEHCYSLQVTKAQDDYMIANGVWRKSWTTE